METKFVEISVPAGIPKDAAAWVELRSVPSSNATASALKAASYLLCF